MKRKILKGSLKYFVCFGNRTDKTLGETHSSDTTSHARDSRVRAPGGVPWHTSLTLGPCRVVALYVPGSHRLFVEAD